MSCPTNSGDGRGTQARPARVRPRFRISAEAECPADTTAGERVLVEAETSDISEEQFAASLEGPSSQSRPRFIPGGKRSQGQAAQSEAPVKEAPAISSPGAEIEGAADFSVEGQGAVQILEAEPPESEASRQHFEPEFVGEAEVQSLNEDSTGGWEGAQELAEDAPEWRQEVAARLNNYHSRRRRKPPRYPSLALKFDPPVPAPSRAAEAPRAAYQPAGRAEMATAAAAEEMAAEQVQVEEAPGAPFDSGNIIEFPRPLIPPPPRPDELAEPILDLPRILDAPEAVSKQVPLGGIILEPEQLATASELELPLRVAPLGRRVLAAGLDGALVGAATLMFFVIVNKMATLLPSIHVLLGLGVALPAVLWAIFQYVFLVYTGSTPGMRLTKLRLAEFEGSAPGRGTRRWRALALALSAVSLGLGFLWCLLDEDTLCWHDRITRTYLDAGPAAEPQPQPAPVFPERLFACLRRVESFLQRRAEETSDEAGPPEP